MIFQFAINLNIKNKDVQAIIDLDTGMIGFAEKINNDIVEYNWYNCPREYRNSFFVSLEDKAAKNSYGNCEINRKNEAADVLYSFFKSKNNKSI